MYLRTINNKVSDAVEAETRDLCKVRLLLSYRVNFEGESTRWFTVENYVKFLCDHLRSLLRHAVKQHGVEDFYARAAAVVRDVILGAAHPDGKRVGRLFEENGMRVYDVEVLDVSLGDDTIAKMLVEAQHAAVSGALHVATEQRRLEMVRHSEETKQRVGELQAASRLAEMDTRLREVERQRELSAAESAAESALDRLRHEARRDAQALLDAVHGAELARKRAESDAENDRERQRVERDLTRLAGEVRAVVEKAGAVSPDLIAALQSFSDRALAERMAEAMAPLAILGGESVSDVLGRLLQGTPAAKALAKKG